VRSGQKAVAPPPPAQAPSSLRPVHLAILGTVAAATAGTLLAHGTRVENLAFLFLAIACTGVVAGLVYRTFAPLGAGAPLQEPEMVGGRTRAALERDKALTLRAIKELEFDRAMGKVSEADGQEMVTRLRQRAMRLMRQLDEGDTGYRDLIERELRARLGAAQDVQRSEGPKVRPSTPARGALSDVEGRRSEGAIGTSDSEGAGERPGDTAQGFRPAQACAVCGAQNDVDARFCKKCGAKLGVPA